MSSRRRYAVDPSYPPLSEIIELEPEKEPWCAGYAPSKGRRCHARTNAHGRRSATAILNEGTKELRAGRSVTSLLKELAPHVLCTRFHQNQASDLVSRWKRDVRAYRDSQDAYIPPVRSTRRSSRSVYLDSIESDSEETIDFLQRRLRYLQEEVRRLEVARYGSPISAPPRTRRVDRSTSAVSSGNVEPAPRRSTPRESLAEDTVRRRPLQPINESEINVPRPALAQVITQTREVPVSSSRPATPPATAPASSAPASSSTGNPQIQDEAPQAIRREVEGECGICLENLHISQEEVDTNEEQEIEHSGDNDDDSDDHNNPEHDDPEHDDPEHDDPEHDDPEHDDPEHDDPEHDDPEHDDPEHDDPEHDDPEHDDPEHDDPEHNDPQHDVPQPNDPEHNDPQHDVPQPNDPEHDVAEHIVPEPNDPGHNDDHEHNDRNHRHDHNYHDRHNRYDRYDRHHYHDTRHHHNHNHNRDHHDHHRDGDKSNKQEEEAEDEKQSRDEEVVWCKARCGVNFHKSCIGEWLENARYPTCPMCRSNWKY